MILLNPMKKENAITMNWKKTTILYYSLSLLLYMCACSSNQNSLATDKELSNLLEQRNYFKFQQVYNESQDILPADRDLYYKAYSEHLFGAADKSNAIIQQLFTGYNNNLNDSIRLKLLDLEADNYIRMYQYENAEVIYRKILKEYKSELDSTELENYLNVQALWGTLKEVKPQKIHRKAATINAQRNMFGYVMTPVQSGGINQEFMFDTGANLSTITETTAQNMKLTMYESEIEVGSSTNLSVQTKLAVADSLYIGDLLFENVGFIVVPDGHMVIPVLDYEITGVIGLPVIQQMEEFHIEKDGTILIPEHIQDRNLHNLCLYGLSAIVQMTTSNDTLLFNLDTGARNTELSNLYYQKHKESVEKEGVLTKRQRAGVGGIVEVEEYHLKDFPYTIGNHNNILPDLKVSLSEYTFYIGLHGNLGEDVFTQFDKMILNFHYKYIDFE